MSMLLEAYGIAAPGPEDTPGTEEWVATLPNFSGWQSGLNIGGVNGSELDGYGWVEKDGAVRYCWNSKDVDVSASSIEYIGDRPYFYSGGWYYFRGWANMSFVGNVMYSIARASSLTPA